VVEKQKIQPVGMVYGSLGCIPNGSVEREHLKRIFELDKSQCNKNDVYLTHDMCTDTYIITSGLDRFSITRDQLEDRGEHSIIRQIARARSNDMGKSEILEHASGLSRKLFDRDVFEFEKSRYENRGTEGMQPIFTSNPEAQKLFTEVNALAGLNTELECMIDEAKERIAELENQLESAEIELDRIEIYEKDISFKMKTIREVASSD
jgi:hypothetical protein